MKAWRHIALLVVDPNEGWASIAREPMSVDTLITRYIIPLSLLAPTLLVLVVFFFYPLALAVSYSFEEWDLLTPPRAVGLGAAHGN